VLITGTAAEVTPVSEIGPYKFTTGEVCRTLIADFTATVNPRKAAAEKDFLGKSLQSGAD
jgi:branched-chain amino acid aminotransferase